MTCHDCMTRDIRTQIFELLSSKLLLFSCLVFKFRTSHPTCRLGIVIFLFVTRKSKFLVCKRLALVHTARNDRARICAQICMTLRLMLLYRATSLSVREGLS